MGMNFLKKIRSRVIPEFSQNEFSRRMNAVWGIDPLAAESRYRYLEKTAVKLDLADLPAIMEIAKELGIKDLELIKFLRDEGEDLIRLRRYKKGRVRK